MSLNLNVIIGNNKILDAIRLYQAAGRNKLTENEANNKLEANAKTARAAEFTKQGLDANGENKDSSKKKRLLPEDKVTSYRGKRAGMSVAWRFSRLKEQPTIFTATTPRSQIAPCTGGTITSSGWYSKYYQTYKIYSGDGSKFYEFDDGYDYTSYWTAAESLPTPPSDTLNYIPYLPSRGSFGPINPDFPDVPVSNTGSTITTSHQYWLPVGPNLLLYYFYTKRQTVFQFTTQQFFVDCNDPSDPDDRYGSFSASVVEDPTEEIVSINEHCLLVGGNSIKQLTVPTAFRDYFNDRTSSYSKVSATGYVMPEISNSFNGQIYGPVYYQGFRWEVQPPKETPPDDYLLWDQKRKEGFSVRVPFPGSNLSSSSNSFSTGYFITTGGGYRSLVGSESTDYDAVYSKAPGVNNLNDETGFLSGDSWETIFDNSTELKFDGDFNNKKVKTSSVVMAQTERPQDPLNYTTPEGFQVISNWTPQIVIGYDWGNPNYCRSQLAKLGFTAANLSP